MIAEPIDLISLGTKGHNLLVFISRYPKADI